MEDLPDKLGIQEVVSRGIKNNWVNPAYWNRQYVTASHISNNVPKGSSVLELGKDTKNVHYLTDPVKCTLVIPPANAEIKQDAMREEVAKLGVPFTLHCERPLDTIPLQPASFDVALIFDMLDGAPEQAAMGAVALLSRSLRQGGRLLFLEKSQVGMPQLARDFGLSVEHEEDGGFDIGVAFRKNMNSGPRRKRTAVAAKSKKGPQKAATEKGFGGVASKKDKGGVASDKLMRAKEKKKKNALASEGSRVPTADDYIAAGTIAKESMELEAQSTRNEYKANQDAIEKLRADFSRATDTYLQSASEVKEEKEITADAQVGLEEESQLVEAETPEEPSGWVMETAPAGDGDYYEPPETYLQSVADVKEEQEIIADAKVGLEEENQLVEAETLEELADGVAETAPAGDGNYYEMNCPENLGIDRIVRIELSDGRQFDVRVPDEVLPGNSFLVGPFP